MWKPTPPPGPVLSSSSSTVEVLQRQNLCNSLYSPEQCIYVLLCEDDDQPKDLGIIWIVIIPSA
ncbi:unnamed protein product, partial [Amoebophrya sp. A25]|eukprot:GSA25T00003967001.1